MKLEREEAWLWLCSIAGLNSRQRDALVRYFGSPEQVWESGAEEFALWERVGLRWVRKAAAAKNETFLEQAHQQLDRHRVHFISRDHPLFPGKLKQIADCPCGLFYKGSLPLENRLSVAVVGARSCSNYGRVIAIDLAGHLAREGIQVISGMAAGIDGIAQKTALEAGGCSFGVLGCGADICYPKQNFSLYMDLGDPARGGLLSEYPCGVEPRAMLFPQRNRIISGLSDAVVIVEAREKSGTLITADFALDQGREIYAVPGRCCDERSAGVNRLIREGAAIYLTAEELVEQLRQLHQTVPLTETIRPASPSARNDAAKNAAEGNLSDTARALLEAMDLEPADLSELCEKTGLGIPEVTGALLELQLEGAVKELYRGCFAKNRLHE